MLEALRIDALRARYWLPPDRSARRFALDRVHSQRLPDLVAAALADADLGPDAVVCIRSLQVAVRLEAGAREDEWAERWTAAVAGRIAAAVRKGAGADVVVYPSRSALRLDALLGALAGRIDRAWAWKQARVVDPATAERPGPLLASMAQGWLQDPRVVVPTLVAAAARAGLAPLLEALPPVAWRRLAEAARSAHGYSSVAVAPAPPESAQVVRAVHGRSRLWRELVRLAPTLARAWPAAEGGATVFSLVELALVEAHPALVADRARFDGVVEHLVRAVAARMAPPAGAAGADGRSDEPPAAEPSPAAADPVVDRVRLAQAAAKAHFEDPRAEGYTEEGGILFFLRPLALLDFPARAATDPATRHRPLDEVLHRFARRWRALAPDDPAALAFAGYPPDAPAPSEGPADDALAEWLDAEAARLTAWLSEVWVDEIPSDLTGHLCRRRARVVGERGWLTVIYSLDDVSTAVRRAGLDLDPGWLPWLGAVVKFRYE